MKQSQFPPGWNEERVQKVLEHYVQVTRKALEAWQRSWASIT
jgi:hypothetical protein